MAGSLSDYAENEILDHILDTGAYTPATNLYVGLSTATINDASTGGACGETTGTDYLRVEMNTWDAASSRATENTNVVTFAEAGGAWGTISDWFVADATADGNIICYGTFSVAKAVNTGDDASIAAGGIDVSVDSGGMSDFLANEILDHVFKTGVYTAATTFYVGLSTGTIADATSGDACDEVTGTNYSRKACDTWDGAASGATKNTAAITFDVSSGSWGTVTDFFIADASTDGNILFYEAADASKVVGTGDTVQFDADSFDITLD